MIPSIDYAVISLYYFLQHIHLFLKLNLLWFWRRLQYNNFTFTLKLEVNKERKKILNNFFFWFRFYTMKIMWIVFKSRGREPWIGKMLGTTKKIDFCDFYFILIWIFLSNLKFFQFLNQSLLFEKNRPFFLLFQNITCETKHIHFLVDLRWIFGLFSFTFYNKIFFFVKFINARNFIYHANTQPPINEIFTQISYAFTLNPYFGWWRWQQNTNKHLIL